MNKNQALAPPLLVHSPLRLNKYAIVVLACAAVFASAAHPATPPASKSAPTPELLNAPLSEPAPKEAPAAATKSAPSAEIAAPAEPAAPVSAPPVVAPVIASTPTPPAVLPEPVAQTNDLYGRFLRASLTDVLVALFTLVVALFAWRLSAVATRFAATTKDQLDANRRMVEASERASDAAQRSADAAEKSAVLMQNTAARQLRPYVSVKEFLQGPVKDEKGLLHGWVFQVVWQNTGATPTRGFRYWAALKQFEREIPADFDFAPPALADFAGGELGHNASVTSGTLFIGQQDVAQLQAGTRKAVLYGKAEYTDVLGQDVRHETRFSVDVLLAGEASGANLTPFSFSYHAKHNNVT
jgi:hypothetical protein